MTTNTAHREAGVRVSTPPRENIVRALMPGAEFVRSKADGLFGTLRGHFAVFNEWTEINSMWEGNFMERISPGAFRKTIRENRDGMRVLFQHGQDPQIGDKVLGPINELREDTTGAYYEVDLMDTSYNRDLLPGLEKGLYGASFRFKVMREEIVDNPPVSDDNPHALPERTIKEAMVREFGPVTFGAYSSATAEVRSLTDEFVLGRHDPDKLLEVLELLKQRSTTSVFVTDTTSSNNEEETESEVAPDDVNAERDVHLDESSRDSDATDDGAADEPHPVTDLINDGLLDTAPPARFTELFGMTESEKPKWQLP